MASYTRLPDGSAERHSIRAIVTGQGIERMASLWIKTASGIVKVYEAVRSCFGAGRWRPLKPWKSKDLWKGN